jgi:hypothetical protein
MVDTNPLVHNDFPAGSTVALREHMRDRAAAQGTAQPPPGAGAEAPTRASQPTLRSDSAPSANPPGCVGEHPEQPQ